MDKLSARAIVIGGLADIFLSGLLSVVLESAVMARLGTLHSARPHVHAEAAAALQASAGHQLTVLLIGLGCSVFGGYVAARLAAHDELRNGACSAILCLLLGLLTMASGRDSRSLKVQVVLLAASPVCGLLGGYLEVTRQRRTLLRTPASG